MAGVAVRMLQLVAGHAFHAQRRGLGAFFHLQALVLGIQAARLGHRAVQLGEQAARLVLGVHQIQGADQHRQQQHQVQARHAAS